MSKINKPSGEESDKKVDQSRRRFLKGIGALAGLAATGGLGAVVGRATAPKGSPKNDLSDAEGSSGKGQRDSEGGRRGAARRDTVGSKGSSNKGLADPKGNPEGSEGWSSPRGRMIERNEKYSPRRKPGYQDPEGCYLGPDDEWK